MTDHFDSERYTTSAELPALKEQLQFLDDLVVRLHRGETVSLSKQDAPMIQGISENTIALRLILSSKINGIA